jgi:hypothetical protein
MEKVRTECLKEQAFNTVAEVRGGKRLVTARRQPRPAALRSPRPCGRGLADEPRVEYVDGRLAGLLADFAEATTLICADHGDCWGEDGLWEHGISH